MDNIKKIDLFPSGIVAVPSSKSITHRAIICAGLAGGASIIRNVSLSEDIEATIDCVRALGGRVEKREDGALEVEGGASQHNANFDCGESGTTLRLMIPIAAASGTNNPVFTGRGRLLQRPLKPYAEALGKHNVELVLNDDKLMLNGLLTPGEYHLPGDVSSQYVSGLLLALPMLGGRSEIILDSPLESASYVDLTLDMMQKFGVYAENRDYSRFIIEGGQCYKPTEIEVEADFSQAAFFLVAGALGAKCGVKGLTSESRQGDRAMLRILEASGAELEYSCGVLYAKPGRLTAQTVDVTDIPDLVPPMAAFFALCDGESRITGAARLRYKESDRLEAVTEALNALGAKIRIEGDGLVINGVPALRGGLADSKNDHRIAMMCAVAAIRSDGAVSIKNPDCVAKSYPGFWTDFCCEKLEERAII